MRMSSFDRFSTSVDSLQRRQQELARTQEQMTSGKRIERPSDDPAALARAERAYASQQRITTQQRSIDASRTAMTLAESTLGQANDVLQAAREMVVSAGNGTYTQVERRSQVAELRNYREQLLGLANQSDGGSGFIFGGQGATSAPFLDQPGGVVSVNTPGQLQLSGSEVMPTTLDGRQVWLAVPSGNGVFVTAPDADNNTGTGWITPGSVANPAALTGSSYEIVFSSIGDETVYTVLRDGSPTTLTDQPYRSGGAIEIDGQSVTINGEPAEGDRFTLEPSTRSLDIFEALDRLIGVLDGTLDSDDSGGARIMQAVNSGLRDVDAVIRHVQATRAQAGAMLTRLDAMDERAADRKLAAVTVQSDAEDVDMVESISAFQSQQTGYQAALQSYASVQRMSLFDYLK